MRRPVRYAGGEVRDLRQGAKIFANGYAGAFVRQYAGQMIEVRLPGGVCCLDASQVVLLDEFHPEDHFPSRVSSHCSCKVCKMYPELRNLK